MFIYVSDATQIVPVVMSTPRGRCMGGMLFGAAWNDWLFGWGYQDKCSRRMPLASSLLEPLLSAPALIMAKKRSVNEQKIIHNCFISSIKMIHNNMYTKTYDRKFLGNKG